MGVCSTLSVVTMHSAGLGCGWGGRRPLTPQRRRACCTPPTHTCAGATSDGHGAPGVGALVAHLPHMQVQPVMAAERLVFYRERAASMYAPIPFAIATGVVEIPYLILQSGLMVVITYCEPPAAPARLPAASAPATAAPACLLTF